MVENGGEITAPISISLEFQMRSDSSLSLLLPFYSYTDYYQIQKYKQFVKTSAAIFQSRKCHNANFWVLDCLKDNHLQPGKIMIYFSRFQHQQRTIRMNCKMELQNFYLHCLLETWSVPLPRYTTSRFPKNIIGVSATK